MVKVLVLLVIVWVLVFWLISLGEHVTWWSYLLAVVFPGLVLAALGLLRTERA